MTTPPAWPVSLPQEIQMRGYTESAPNVTIASTPDLGPSKVRRRMTASIRPVKGSITVTDAQLNDLITFYNTALLGGALRFTWVDPRNSAVPVEFRFVKPLSWVSDEGKYSVALDLEILP
ncbi:hypothetical protein UFOVP1299_44 [uncultured Caudovirales phage]|uniref:Minor tail protein n=1 Tax=uncultured Caudovirales phage TaxID=2100421 RepID=A0A6J5RNQ8_9CAUD|nr:hypothetical protein UFOVP1299_44 [uncultured Caudovirales phage]